MRVTICAWAEYETLLTDSGDFGEIGAAFDQARNIVVRQINAASVCFVRQRPVVDFAVTSMEQHRESQGRA